jgi:hypothetical protein
MAVIIVIVSWLSFQKALAENSIIIPRHAVMGSRKTIGCARA